MMTKSTGCSVIKLKDRGKTGCAVGCDMVGTGVMSGSAVGRGVGVTSEPGTVG
jgi:hypothetical protein